MIDPGLTGRVVLLTGANHGIGAATALAFAAQGAAVFLTYLRAPLAEGDRETVAASDSPGPALYRARQAETADAVRQAIRERSGRADACEADLADPGSIPLLFDGAEAALGPVEVLVHNAAHCTADTFLDGAGVTAESHDRHFAVNSRAAALLIAEYARRHRERGANWGRIVTVSTDSASGFAGEVSYGASKHALESYSRAAAAELGPLGITVNIVSPGPVQTGWIDADLEARLLPTIPLRRIGQPEEIADVILFLASEQARWVTGQLLYAGGGHVMPL